MRFSDWSSDVCSSDLDESGDQGADRGEPHEPRTAHPADRFRPALWETRGMPRGVSRVVVVGAGVAGLTAARDLTRSEGRRVGIECVSMCRSRWSLYHYK